MKHLERTGPRGPLSGVRVLDLSAYIAGPYGCSLLADQGAEVLKIEPPDGDNLRKYPSSLAAESRAFLGVNRSKYASLSGIGGNLFLRSSEMAGELYGAMECRGFTGKYTAVKRFRLSPADLLYILVNLAMVLAFIFLGRV